LRSLSFDLAGAGFFPKVSRNLFKDEEHLGKRMPKGMGHGGFLDKRTAFPISSPGRIPGVPR
jgi:hypothetical protein